ncbi:Transcription factor FER-LIKE IRON DEFICIENCY-INDUCED TRANSCRIPTION FACTOR [Sesamum alatum]|uniref:Transcription factor FER-LIKE IRON DEFICIENCY-INDUCED TRANSCRIPTION FACTOR n=1 Tax=Sesamum alatum TaxID=300844 RepID=A0AAE1Z2C2_9LAMI|nr:Transcription factor FER-LIKE IRON DEFICIENCY-INDUCED TRANSCRIPTION FACTOR [Sesamum alatum]
MERSFLETGAIFPQLDQYYQYATDNFGLIDFTDEAIFDQFIDLIRGENENETVANFAAQGYDFHDQFFSAAPAAVELLDFDGLMAHNVDADANIDFGLQNACVKNVSEEGVMDVEESSAATTTTTTTATTAANKKSSKVDRSRTLISERRRRGRMKEKLYALRALVPTITKMDKASIVGDAVLYVQDLQMQLKKLKSDISSLETGNVQSCQRRTTAHNYAKNINVGSFYHITKKILKMDVFEVEERGFYVRMVSNKGRGIAALLYKALESLTTFILRTSNLAASADNYVLTFTLHIMDGEKNIDLQNMELWIASVFLKQGFEFET